MKFELSRYFYKAWLIFVFTPSIIFSLDTLQVLNEDSLKFFPKKALDIFDSETSPRVDSSPASLSKENWTVEGESYIQFIGGDESRFQQNIDLEMKGDLDSSISIYGELRDSDLPSPGEGGEASLRDIDKAYLAIQGVRGGVELGDQSFKRGRGSWMAQESFLGVSGNWNLDSSFFVKSGLGVERVQKEAVLLYGEEGVQGAYSVLNRTGAQLVEGSVEIRLNGLTLEEKVDFEVEEATGNIYFLSTTFIRDGDVIDVRYSVLEDEVLPMYARYADLEYRFDEQSISFQLWDEGLRLDGTQAELINVGEETYFYTPYQGDSVEYQGFDNQGAYGVKDGAYLYLKEPISGDYVYYPNFVFVGDSTGDYINQEGVYIYAGKGMGDYLAGYIQKDSPDLKLLSLNYSANKDDVEWNVDYSVIPEVPEAFVNEGFLRVKLPSQLYFKQDWLMRSDAFQLELVNYNNWFLWSDLKVRELPDEKVIVSKSRLGIESYSFRDLWLESTVLNSDSLGVARTELGSDIELPIDYSLSQSLSNVIDFKSYGYEYNDYFLKVDKESGFFRPRIWGGYLEYYRAVGKQRGLREFHGGLGSFVKPSEIMNSDFDFEYDWSEDSLSRKTVVSKLAFLATKYSLKLNSSMSWLDDLIIGEESQNYLLSLKSTYRVIPRLGSFRFNFEYGYFKDQKLIKKYQRVDTGTGDVVFDESDSTYIEGVVFGDYILEGFVRDSSNSAVYSNNVDWDFNHQVVLGRLLNINSGFFNDLTLRNSLLWESVDTSASVQWLPQFEKDWNEGVFDLTNVAIWNSGKHVLDLKRNIFHSKIFGLKKNRKLIWGVGQNSTFSKLLLESRLSSGDYNWGEEQYWKELLLDVKPGYRLPFNLKSYLLGSVRDLSGESFGETFQVENYELGNEWVWVYEKQLLSTSYRFIRTTGEFSKLPLRVKGDLLDGDYHNVQLNSQVEISDGIGLDANINVYFKKGQEMKAQVRVNLGGQF